MDMKLLYFFVFLLMWYLVFNGLNKLVVKFLSYDIDKRYLHIRLVISAILFMILSSNKLVSSYAVLLVDRILNTKYIAAFLNMIMPNKAYEIVYLIVCNLVLNLVYVVAFIAVIIITKIIFRKKHRFIEYKYCIGPEKIIHAPWYIVNCFYNDESGKIQLSRKGIINGIWIKAMKCVFAIIWVVEFGVMYYSVIFGDQKWNDMVISVSKSVYLLPMLAFFVIEQIQLFFEGPETNEVGTYGTVKIDENMIGDMDILMYRYREIFSDNGILLYSERGGRSGIDHQGLESNDLGNQQLKDCDKPATLAAITNLLRASGFRQNSNYQNAIAGMLNGDAVIIRDNTYGEFAVYLCAYLNYYLPQGYSAIIVCSDKSEVSEMKDTLTKTYKSISGIDSVWTISEINELEPGSRVGVLICTYEELIANDLKNKHKALASDMFCVVIPDCSSLMFYDNTRIEKVFSRLRSFTYLKQYIFLSEEDNESLRVKIRRYLPEGMAFSTYTNDKRIARTNIMIWKNESVYKPQIVMGIGNPGSPYMGTAFPLALVAAKYDLPKVNIIPCGTEGDGYFFTSARQSNEREIDSYLDKRMELESIIRYSAKEALEPNDLKMIIAYDTDYNIFNTLWRWFKYAGKDGTIIHVISPSYMLREYLAANFKRRSLLYSNNEYNALLPNDAVLKYTLLAAILASLADTGMTEDEIMSISAKNAWDYTDVAVLLKDAICTVKTDKEFHNIYEHLHFEEEKYFDESNTGFVNKVRIRLTDIIMLAQQRKQISLARMAFRKNEYFELSVLGGNIWNYYLPGQIMGFDNKYYTISSIDAGNGIIHTNEASPDMIPDYYPICDYSISEWIKLDNCVDTPIIDYNIFEATVRKRIYGYISTNNGNDFSKESSPAISRINDSDARYQTIKLEHIPVIEINLLREHFGKELADKAKVLLCVILNGMFKTLFPKTYQNIAAVPDMTIDDDLINSVMHNTVDYTAEDMIRASISRINSPEEGRDDRFARIFIIEFSCIEYGMVKAFYENRNAILNKAYDYLDWYIASNKIADDSGSEKETAGIIKGRYLHFGLGSIPEIFAPDALHAALKEILGRNEEETVIKPDHIEPIPAAGREKQICSFCDREIIFAWQLGDGRCMCPHCHDHQKTQKDEIKRLFIETKKMLEEYYHIEFRKDINVRFQDAIAIKKAADRYDRGRVVGFYKHNNRQLWIEARGPSVAMQSTIIHELTHAWQYDVLPLGELEDKFPREVREKRVQLLIEGHAVYVELEAMKEVGEVGYATRLENEYMSGDDVYSLGYQLIADYFVGLDIMGSNANSFVRMKMLVDEIISDEDCVTWPEGY